MLGILRFQLFSAAFLASEVTTKANYRIQYPNWIQRRLTSKVHILPLPRPKLQWWFGEQTIYALFYWGTDYLSW